jgi:hypothetical protein
MSYEPKLLIKVEDLEKHKEKFEKISYGIIPDEKTRGGEDGKTIMEYLSYVYFKHDTYDVFGVECKMCHPCFSSYNKEVRKKLDKLRIEYVCLGG